MDIEFIVQDVFALLRPQWKLASNIEEAGRAFQLAMTQDQKTYGTDKAAEPEEPDSDGEPSDDGEADTGLPGGDGDELSDTESELDVSFISTVLS